MADAAVYIGLTAQALGAGAVGPRRVRIGASGLLADIEAVLEGTHRHEPGTGPGTPY